MSLDDNLCDVCGFDIGPINQTIFFDFETRAIAHAKCHMRWRYQQQFQPKLMLMENGMGL